MSDVPDKSSAIDVNVLADANAITKDVPGPDAWSLSGSLGFLMVVTLIFVGLITTMYSSANINEVKKNWAKYRCQPSVMPFASFYGHSTSDNFSFCMKNIFATYASDVTGPFSDILGLFTEVLDTLGDAMNSMRESVATMGGGINVIFQDFTDRIQFFFFQLRISAIRIKTMIGRIYALMFSVLYMGLSSATAGTNMGNTVLFGFLDTFCFVPETALDVDGKGLTPIRDVRIGDVLLPTRSVVTAKFHFAAHGQPMVQFKNGIQVSTNHYLLHEGRWIQSIDHPDAVPTGPYGRESLFCLNTSDHQLPVGGYVFRDYDETEVADRDTMRMVEERVNGGGPSATVSPYPFSENSPSLHPSMRVRMKDGTLREARHVPIGGTLSTGARVVGTLHKQVKEVCEGLGAATLVWQPAQAAWTRIGTYAPVQTLDAPTPFVSFITVPNSQIELENGTHVRDYLELCSPDAEVLYANELHNLVQ